MNPALMEIPVQRESSLQVPHHLLGNAPHLIISVLLTYTTKYAVLSKICFVKKQSHTYMILNLEDILIDYQRYWFSNFRYGGYFFPITNSWDEWEESAYLLGWQTPQGSSRHLWRTLGIRKHSLKLPNLFQLLHFKMEDSKVQKSKVFKLTPLTGDRAGTRSFASPF